ncbi:hypothetical protein Nepgr_002537 [Nepenthes gracilis]|uniref:NAB domain-containing protein n=1 Tax=Nepenthes gracilis TaxID=150966 RepID=A0AAD3P8X9_NEPGR|nr:hypothetical protein Nepgr_002537 [Nepenthes gracilis]
MLQRAASNAYSWWWASHIRTKQSKWLEQNLLDVEEKVNSMLRIVEQEGDSFAKRAEMYYKKRPELINFVEETYRAYRALAERYDHLSKDLQSANRTIATVFPEQVQLSMESDDESLSGTTAPSPVSEKSLSAPAIPKSFPKAPKFPKAGPQGQPMLVTKRDQLRRTVNAAAVATSSGLSKEDALREIDLLQKEILSLQTEEEFVKSSYESGQAKFWEIENKITEAQMKVCSLQDEFGIGTVIEDHEARSLMAGTALKSCAEALSKLQEKQEQSIEEVKDEYRKIREAHVRLEALKQLQRQSLMSHEPSEEKQIPRSFEEVAGSSTELEEHSAELLKQRIREQLKLDSHSALTEPELAEKIDDLVEKIVSLETALCSQNALVKRLRQEIDDLLAHISSLEEDKESLIEGFDMIKRIRDLEEELSKVNGLNQDLMNHKNSLNAELTEASCSLDHLKEKLQDVMPAEEIEDMCLSREAKAEQEEVEPEKEGKENYLDIRNSDLIPIQQKHEEEEEKPDFSQAEESAIDSELQDLRIEEVSGINWRQLYLNNIEEREKILVEEYTVILRDYKDMKMKLSEVEKKNRDNVFELASHVRELRTTIATKDEEIQHLCKLLASLQSNSQEDIGHPNEQQHRCEARDAASPWSSNVDPDRKPLFHHIYNRNLISENKSPLNEDETKTERHVVSRVEGGFRAELDSLLEANLDFWLRFSTSFHQIQKFQTSIKDLRAELSKLMGAKEESNERSQKSLKSDARPLYKHLREIQTELTLWHEHSSVFQDELKSRIFSLDNIQEEINRVDNDNTEELSNYQAAKFQGEILNMKQENSKVAEELQAGVHRVKVLKVEIEKALTKLDKDFGLSESKIRHASMKSSMSKPRIPLHSFLFGVKLKKQKQKPSIFGCMNPTLQKQHSALPELPK